MKKLIIPALSALILYTSCAHPPKQAIKPSIIPEELLKKAEIYRSEVAKVQDEHGFIETSHCDSTLFSALLGVTGINVNLAAAELAPGQWLRRPVSYPECYSSGASRSTISRDMLLGVMFWAWIHQDILMLTRLWEYGKANNWIMGTPAGTAVMSPNYIALLAKMVAPDSLEAKLPIVVSASGEAGFTRHLLVLYLLLLGEVQGGLSESKIDLLESVARQNPDNILYTAAAIKYGRSIPWSINPRLYPDRLPTSADRCEAWATQRDDGDIGLLPCDQNRTHSGGDLLFVVWLLTR